MGITPWNERIADGDDRDDTRPAGEIEVRDLARGFAGALFVSLPLLFTMEMWEIAKTIPAGVLLALLGVTLVFNRLFLEYSGYRKKAWQRSKWWDAIVTMGIGVVASIITLAVVGIIGADLDTLLTVKVIALETVPTSMGAAVAANQLGSGDAKQDHGLKVSPDLDVVLGSLLGGFLFAFNVAPTMEPKYLATQQDWWLVGCTVFLSLAVSWIMVSVAQFEEQDLDDRRFIDSEWFEAVLAYVIALLVSILLLWIFGYATPGDPLQMWLPQTIVLAYATTLGGAAGRLVL